MVERKQAPFDQGLMLEGVAFDQQVVIAGA